MTSNLVSVCGIYSRHPYVAFNMFDKFINPLPLIWGLCVIISNIVANGVASVHIRRVASRRMAYLLKNFSIGTSLNLPPLPHRVHTTDGPLPVLFYLHEDICRLYSSYH